MRGFLQIVMKERANDARNASRVIHLAQLQRRARHYSLRANLLSQAGETARIIAEVKKASPTSGLLREDYQPAVIAAEYESCGAVGISVLTEPRHFLGSIDDLRAARAAVKLPILCKDFISDPYHVYEAAANGADAILLICAMLPLQRLRELHDIASSLGLETIAEAHSKTELEKALSLEDAIVGINSRNLNTLKTDLEIARKLAPHIPRDRIAIAESGIRTRGDIENLMAIGYKGFLVGEILMRAPDIRAAFRGLANAARGKKKPATIRSTPRNGAK